jgi:hypothetical protein
MPVDVAASVFDRLKRSAREAHKDFNLLLNRYAAERFLYRLSCSAHADSFLLKGAMLFALWERELWRGFRGTRSQRLRRRVRDARGG